MKKNNKALKIQLLRMFVDSYVFLLSYFMLDVCRITQTAYGTAIPIIFANFFLADIIVIITSRKKILNFKQSNISAYYFFVAEHILCIVVSVLSSDFKVVDCLRNIFYSVFGHCNLKIRHLQSCLNLSAT